MDSTNGEDKRFLDSRLTRLEAVVKERWDGFDKTWELIKEELQTIRNTTENAHTAVQQVYEALLKLPCEVRSNDIRWMKGGMYLLYLFVVGIVATIVTLWLKTR